MGHARIDQTLVYLRRKDKQKAMEAVRAGSWGGAGHYGFAFARGRRTKKAPAEQGLR
jgi:hypothetical protein